MSHVYPGDRMAITAICQVLDVVADKERLRAGAQQLVEMAAVTDAPDPGDGERARAGASGRHIGAEHHGGAIADTRPPGEELGGRSVLEPLDEEDTGVALNAHIAGVKGRDAASRRSTRGGHCHRGREWLVSRPLEGTGPPPHRVRGQQPSGYQG